MNTDLAVDIINYVRKAAYRFRQFGIKNEHLIVLVSPSLKNKILNSRMFVVDGPGDIDSIVGIKMKVMACNKILLVTLKDNEVNEENKCKFILKEVYTQ